MVPAMEGLPNLLLQRSAPAAMRLENILSQFFGLIVQGHQAVGTCVTVLWLQTDAYVQVLQACINITLVAQEQSKVVVRLRIFRTGFQCQLRQSDCIRHSAHRTVDCAQVLVGKIHLAVHLQGTLKALHGCLDVSQPPVDNSKVVLRVGMSRIEVDGKLVVNLGAIPFFLLSIKHAEVEVNVCVPAVESKPLLQGLCSLFQFLAL
mmetsp:Transcript_63463/g.149056  ORF Transcript_63463/g.149056 Transcript_63463/m.149056 type:complete len:205 (+) Transcript_63463:135-749(+)